MIRPRWMKVIRDLFSNKARTILVVLSIAVGVFALGMVGGTRSLLKNDLGQAFDKAIAPHAYLFSGGYDPELLKKVRQIPGVAEADGRAEISVRYQSGPDDWKNMTLRAVADYNDIRIVKFFPDQGAWPPPDKEMLVLRSWMRNLGWKQGDTVTIEMPNGRQRTLTIAGSTFDFGGNPPPLGQSPEAYVTFDTLQWLGYPDTYDQLYLRVSIDPTDKVAVQKIADEAQKLLEKSGTYVYAAVVPEGSASPVDDFLNPIIMLLGSLGVLSLALSGFLVVNTISALLAQHTRQVGIMKAVGGRNGQIFGMYLVMVLLFGVCALLIAIPAGGYGAYLLASFIAGLFDVVIDGIHLAPEVVTLQVIVGLLVPLVAAFIPIWAGVRVSVRQAISDYGLGQGSYGTGLLDRLINFFLRFLPISRPMLLSLRNTFRRKFRLVLTLTTLILASAIFVAVFSVRTSALQTIDDVLQYWGFDIQISFERAYRLEQVLPEIMAIPGVEAVETWGGGSVKRLRPDGTTGKDISILAPDAETKLINPYIIEGRWLLPEDENAVVINTDVLKDEPDLKVGDTVKLDLLGQKRDWVVVGLARGVLSGPTMYANYPYFAKITGQVGGAWFAMIKTNVHDATSLAPLSKAIEKHLESVGIRVGGIFLASELRQQFEFIFNIIVVVLLVMAGLLALVGGLGLMGTMSINVIERTREIGVMRAVGASNGAIQRIVIVEGLLIGWISAGVGSLIAVPISQFLSKMVGEQLFQISLSFRFSTEGLILWLVVVTLLSAISSFMPAFQASRLTVRDVLAYE
jgi:putative ABC transport system permease protein